MFVLDGSAEKRVEEYNLSTPYNPDTKTLTNTLANATSSNFHQGLGFNADGSKMFVVKGEDRAEMLIIKLMNTLYLQLSIYQPQH